MTQSDAIMKGSILNSSVAIKDNFKASMIETQKLPRKEVDEEIQIREESTITIGEPIEEGKDQQQDKNKLKDEIQESLKHEFTRNVRNQSQPLPTKNREAKRNSTTLSLNIPQRFDSKKSYGNSEAINSIDEELSSPGDRHG